MDAAVIVAIVITVLVLIGLMVWASRRRTAVRLEEARYRASEERDLARVAEAEAQQQAAAADERAARAERERLAAEQERLEAEQQRRDAAALHQHADEIDPDVEIDLDADGETDVDGERDHLDRAEGDDSETIELREARAAGEPSSEISDARPRER